MNPELSLEKVDQVLVMRKMRHDMSSSLSLIESGMRNISGQSPDVPKAIRVHSVGVEKLRNILTELDSLIEHLSHDRFMGEP